MRFKNPSSGRLPFAFYRAPADVAAAEAVRPLNEADGPISRFLRRRHRRARRGNIEDAPAGRKYAPVLDARARMEDIDMRMNDKNAAEPVSNKERSLYDTLEVCEEIYARGFKIGNVDLYKSKAEEFTVDPDDPKTLIPPFTVIDGLGANVARTVEEAAKEAEFLSKEDIEKRTQLSGTLIKKLDSMGALSELQDRNQMSLF